MSPEQITTLIASFIGYGAVGLSLERLRAEFAEYRKRKDAERSLDLKRTEALEKRTDALEKHAA